MNRFSPEAFMARAKMALIQTPSAPWLVRHHNEPFGTGDSREIQAAKHYFDIPTRRDARKALIAEAAHAKDIPALAARKVTDALAEHNVHMTNIVAAYLPYAYPKNKIEQLRLYMQAMDQQNALAQVARDEAHAGGIDIWG